MTGPRVVKCCTLTEEARLVRIENPMQDLAVHNLLQALQHLHDLGFVATVAMQPRDPLGPKNYRTIVDVREMKP